jgi:uncharacterized protein YchJ
MGLIILEIYEGDADDETSSAEFKAVHLENGKLEQIHVKSLFERDHGKWNYVSGEQI